eukprot:TRINITY_DN18245_c0_g2_i1.p1 TRINITY_DN18245_c0_g2~~TRINITY_DN18245_c0_g2_i1.p1  ORF type:complete len:339 (-),score=94.85 TRINITY_DN18245_c0_g2_i1:52-1002(-)
MAARHLRLAALASLYAGAAAAVAAALADGPACDAAADSACGVSDPSDADATALLQSVMAPAASQLSGGRRSAAVASQGARVATSPANVAEAAAKSAAPASKVEGVAAVQSDVGTAQNAEVAGAAAEKRLAGDDDDDDDDGSGAGGGGGGGDDDDDDDDDTKAPKDFEEMVDQLFERVGQGSTQATSTLIIIGLCIPVALRLFLYRYGSRDAAEVSTMFGVLVTIVSLYYLGASGLLQRWWYCMFEAKNMGSCNLTWSHWCACFFTSLFSVGIACDATYMGYLRLAAALSRDCASEESSQSSTEDLGATTKEEKLAN